MTLYCEQSVVAESVGHGSSMRTILHLVLLVAAAEYHGSVAQGWTTEAYDDGPGIGPVWVSCGCHEAPSCRQCGTQKYMCNGDCTWDWSGCHLKDGPPRPTRPPTPTRPTGETPVSMGTRPPITWETPVQISSRPPPTGDSRPPPTGESHPPPTGESTSRPGTNGTTAKGTSSVDAIKAIKATVQKIAVGLKDLSTRIIIRLTDDENRLLEILDEIVTYFQNECTHKMGNCEAMIIEAYEDELNLIYGDILLSGALSPEFMQQFDDKNSDFSLVAIEAEEFQILLMQGMGVTTIAQGPGARVCEEEEAAKDACSKCVNSGDDSCISCSNYLITCKYLYRSGSEDCPYTDVQPESTCRNYSNPQADGKHLLCADAVGEVGGKDITKLMLTQCPKTCLCSAPEDYYYYDEFAPQPTVPPAWCLWFFKCTMLSCDDSGYGCQIFNDVCKHIMQPFCVEDILL